MSPIYHMSRNTRILFRGEFGESPSSPLLKGHLSLVKGQQCNCIIRLFFMRILIISLVKGQQCNCIIRLFFMRICVISLVQGQQCNCIIRLFFMRICIISLVQGQALRERPKCNRKNLNLRGWLPSDQHILFTIF